MPKVPGIRNPRSDNTAPTVPTNLVATALSTTSISLTWTASTDAGVGVAGYQIWRDYAPIAVRTVTNYTDSGLEPGTPYEYHVSAYDANGNMSGLSLPSSATTDEAGTNADPVWQTIAQQELTTGTSFSLPLGSFVTDPEGLAISIAQVSGTLPTGVTLNTSTKIVSGTPTAVLASSSVVFRATDLEGAFADTTVVFNCLGADTTAPSVPTNLAGTGVSRQRIDLTWTASTDTAGTNQRASGLAGYKLYRDGSLRATLGLVTSYSDTGLSTATTYSYRLSAFDVALNESAQCTAVPVTTAANSNPEWVTPAALPTVTHPVTSTVTMRLLATDDDGDPITYSTGSTLPSGVTLTELTSPLGALLTVPAGTAESVTNFTVSATDTVPGVGESWEVRSTRSGVVWAHDFREASEVTTWRYGGGTFTYQPPNALDCQWVASSGLGSSGAVSSTIRATTLTAPVAAVSGSVTISVADASQFPDPAVYPNYEALLGNAASAEDFIVTARSLVNNTITGNKTTTLAHGIGDGFHFRDRTQWNRPMGAFTSAENGKSTDDIGIANGFKNRDIDLITGGGNPLARSQYRYRGAYWGHPSYRALYHAAWPINGYDGYSTGNNDSYTELFDSTDVTGEFYIQWRMKVSASRFNNPPGKLFYLQPVNETAQQQLYVVLDTTAGNRLTLATAQSGETVFVLRRPDTSLYLLPSDTWVTWMIHVIPGRNLIAETTVELFAAENGAWVTLGSRNNVQTLYSMPAVDNGNPPAHNGFRPDNYANPYATSGGGSSGASTSTHSIQYTQIILSRNTIAVPA
jgi:hypothetical protein